MNFSVVLAYFLVITTYALLAYNFLKMIFYSFQREPPTSSKNSIRFQQFVLVVILIGMIVFQNIANDTETRLSVIPWIWGFLAGHFFVPQKKQRVNELVGLGILLAMTIILFFKQTEIIEFITSQSISMIITEIHLVYLFTGFVLGIFFWANSSS